MKYDGTKTNIPRSLQEQIESLNEGKSLFIEIASDCHIKTFQNKVYAFLHRAGIKPLYRIYAEDRILRIRRLSEESDYKILIDSQPLTSIENFVIDNMRDIEDEAEAMERIKLGIENKELREENIISTYEEWRRGIKGESSKPSISDQSSSYAQLEKVHEEDEDKLKQTKED